MKASLAVLLIVLAGCASATQIRGSRGEPLVLIECNGMVIPLGACFDKAAKECPAGYRTLNTEMNNGPVIVSGNQFGLYGGQVQQKAIVVECLGAPGQPTAP